MAQTATINKNSEIDDTKIEIYKIIGKVRIVGKGEPPLSKEETSKLDSAVKLVSKYPTELKDWKRPIEAIVEYIKTDDLIKFRKARSEIEDNGTSEEKEMFRTFEKLAFGPFG